MATEHRPTYSAARPGPAAFPFVLTLMCAWMLSGCAAVGSPELTARVQAVPEDVRDDVHIYLLNSPLDQFHFGRLGDVAAYLRKAGFEHASYRHWVDGKALGRELLRLREQDPQARIALVGWSGGSLAVWDATTELDAHDQIVDCIVYLDSNWIKGRIDDRGHPDNVIRLVCIYNESREPPAGLPAATVHRVETRNHMAVPVHPDAVEALIAELIATATQSRF